MKILWTICSIIGIAAAILSYFVLKLSPVDGGNFNSGYGNPLMAFLFSNSSEDVALVFGSFEGPLRSARIDGMRISIYADFPYIAAYGSFFLLFFISVFKQTGRWIWLIFGLIGVVAAIGDAIEDVILLGILDDPDMAPLVTVLAVPVYIKFFGIALASIGAGVFLSKQESPIWKVFGVLSLFSGLAVIIGLIFPRQLVWTLVYSIAIGGIAMLIYSITRIFSSVSKV